jgi:hypothetical protein
MFSWADVSDVSCLLWIFIAIGSGAIVLLVAAIAIRLSAGDKFQSWGQLWQNVKRKISRISPLLRVALSIWSLIQLLQAGGSTFFFVPSATVWSETPPSLSVKCSPLFSKTQSYVEGTVSSKALYSFSSSLQHGSFFMVRLCTDSPPALVDAYFAKTVTTDKFSVGDRSLCGANDMKKFCDGFFCDSKDCLPLDRCTIQQIADECKMSPASNPSMNCQHLLKNTPPLPNGFLWKSFVSCVPDSGCGLVFDVNNDLPNCPYNYVYTLTTHSSPVPLMAAAILFLFIALQAIVAICCMASSEESTKAWVMETRVVGDVFTLITIVRCAINGEAVPDTLHPIGQFSVLLTDLLEVIVIPWFYISGCPLCSFTQEAYFVFFKSIKVIQDSGSLFVSLSAASNSNVRMGRVCCCIIFTLATVFLAIFGEQLGLLVNPEGSTSTNTTNRSATC